jgi:manganese/zinc/iron transport system permease protein
MSGWDAYDWLTVAISATGNAACALVGCALMLRRLALLGDAISHAVLPGIAVAYLVVGRVNPLATLLAAALVGILVAWLVERLQSLGKVAEDASLGIVFTSLFAVGVILIHRAAENVDLDPGCVLFGALELSALDFVTVAVPGFSGGMVVPRSLAFLSLGLLVVLTAFALFWKEWKLTAFDPALAAAMGFHPRRLHYLLMALASVVAVVSFESVGSILVVAMMVVPPAAARLLVDGYGATFAWSAVLAVVISVAGHALAVTLNANEAGSCATAAGAVLALAVMFGPRHGLVVRAYRRLRLALDVAVQDLLGGLYREEERGAPATPLPPPANWRESLARRLIVRQGLAVAEGDGLRMTANGREQAQSLVRAHRLWESYLDRNFALPTDHLHEPAHRIEHVLDPTLQRQVQEELHRPKEDPHGRAIPAPSGTPRSQNGA